MRRILTELAAYLSSLAQAVRLGWMRFFFSPADPTTIGLIRPLLGLLLVWNLVVYGLDLRAFFSSEGWVDPAALRTMMAEQHSWAWSFWLWVPDGLLWPVWLLCLGVLILYTAGLWSRVTAVLAWVIVVSTARRVPVALYGFDQIISTLALYLAVTGASGQALALDRLLAKRRALKGEQARGRRKESVPGVAPSAPAPTISANLTLRLIQLHLALIYGMAGLAKLRGNVWWDGTAAWGILASGEFRRFDLTWLVAYPLLLNAMTHAGLFLELSYPVLIWVRPLRPLLLAAAVVMHFVIDLTLGLTEFGLAMIVANLAFVSGPWLRGLWGGHSQRA